MEAKRLPLLGAGAAALAFALTGGLYLHDHHVYVRRARRGSQIMQTARGPIETTVDGEGPPVLALHGGGGGYDQGVMLGRMLHGFQVIAPSRPGYLRTPLDVGRSHAEQADAMIALLDALRVERVAIFAASAGGPIGLQMALRHPDRCASLVMCSALSMPLDLSPEYERFVRLLMASDFIPWAIMRVNVKQAIRSNGPLPREVERDREKMTLLRLAIEHSCIASLRSKGAMNDMHYSCKSSFNYALSDIKTPTLVMHGTVDPAVPVTHGEHSARSIPGARFVPVEGGGHFCFITHSEQVAPLINDFIAEQFAAARSAAPAR